MTFVKKSRALWEVCVIVFTTMSINGSDMRKETEKETKETKEKKEKKERKKKAP